MYKCKYFKISELVNPALIKQYGEANCWMFFDDRLLKYADHIREKYGPVIVNGSGLTDCGARAIDSKTGASLSAHKLFRALDLHIVNIEKKCGSDKAKKAQEYKKVREEILKDPAWSFINFETTSNGQPIWWLHSDTYNRDKREFNA